MKPLLKTEQEPVVDYEMVDRIPEERGMKHRIVDVTIENAPSPDIELDVAQLGIRRLVHLNAQTLDGFWSVTWNGDMNNPTLSLDPYPEEENVTVRLQVLGK